MSYDFVVKPQKVELKDFQPSNGGMKLDVLPVTYEEYGSAASKDGKDKPVAVILPYFLGNQHAAGFSGEGKDKKPTGPGYWNALIGPKCAIDTDVYRVISIGPIINSRFGPATLDPHTKKPFGSRFPVLSISDYARAQVLALQALKIHHVDVLMGASMGSLQAIELAFSNPDFFTKLMLVVPGGVVLSRKTRTLTTQWVNQFERDPIWNGGDYYESKKPPILSLTKVLSDFWYRCQFPLDETVGWDDARAEALERFYLYTDSDMVGFQKTIDMVLAEIANRTQNPGVQRYHNSLKGLLASTDPNMLLWQLQAVLTHDLDGYANHAEYYGNLDVASGQSTQSPVFRMEGKSVMAVMTREDDLLPSEGALTALALAKEQGAKVQAHVLPKNTSHAAGLNTGDPKNPFNSLQTHIAQFMALSQTPSKL